MNLIQLTPGAGAMFCGNCFRDNALVAALRKLGHEAHLVPLYLPLNLDENDESAGTPIFFSGINVFLEQKSAWFRRAPAWLHHLFAGRKLLSWVGTKAARTQPSELGELTLSMLQGEEGNQARELNELLAWLLQAETRPDVICLSNALLLGMARRLKSELGVPIVCTLQGEDAFLDALPTGQRAECWRTLAERAAEVDLLIAPSRYFADLMSNRLRLPPARVRVVHNGIDLSGYSPPEKASRASRSQESDALPVLGFFARMCREKGLDTLVEAFISLRRRGRVPDLKLSVGGSCGPGDKPFVDSLRQQLAREKLLEHAQFHPNLDHAQKVQFLQGLSVFSVPALYGEAFGLYLIEAMAAGVPVVQPRVAAFPELIDVTGGGVLCKPGDPQALAETIENVLLERGRAQSLGQSGARAVFENFSAQAMARRCLAVFEETRLAPPLAQASTLNPLPN